MTAHDHTTLATYYRSRLVDAPAKLYRRFANLARAHELMARRSDVEPVLLRMAGLAGKEHFTRFLESIQ